MLVVLLIMSIVTTAAIPTLKKQTLRRHEQHIRHDLAMVRESIDRFHKDWRTGVMAKTGSGISRDGFPTSWDALIEGVQSTEGQTLRYLRSIPSHPFSGEEDPWLLLGYRDDPTATQWNEIDIYDLRANTDRIAQDGSEIRDW